MTLMWKYAALLMNLVVISRRPDYAKGLGLPEPSREPASDFPLRDQALAQLGPHEIVERHDDGDLTIRKDTTLYVVTTDGKMFRQLPNGGKIEMATAVALSPEGKSAGVNPSVNPSVNPTASERKPAPSIYQGTSQLSAAGKACIPCGNDHFSTVAGQLGESMRFAREGDITHPEVLSRVAHAEDELNVFEREDGAPEKVAKLPPAEKAIMDEMLVASRKLRHALSNIKDVADLEKAAAEAQEARVQFRAKLFGLQLQRLSPEQVKRIAEKMARPMAEAAREPLRYIVAAKRLDKTAHKTIYVKKSSVFDDKWKAELALKDLQKKHPYEEYAVIEANLAEGLRDYSDLAQQSKGVA